MLAGAPRGGRPPDAGFARVGAQRQPGVGRQWCESCQPTELTRARQGRLEPLSADRFEVQLTASTELRDELQHAANLMLGNLAEHADGSSAH